MNKYSNFGSMYVPNNSGGMMSRLMSAGGNLTSNNGYVIGLLSLLGFIIIISVVYYYYFSKSSSSTSSTQYSANSEYNTNGSNSSNNTAELLFFYADWCPHCKTAKPIWNELSTEYENKTINGYKIIFTEVNCSEETAEVEKLMNQYNIEGYPTIKLIKDGQVIEYDAKPSKATLTEFLNTVL